MVTERDLQLGDGRTLHLYDTCAEGVDARLTVVWHHGTPNTGAPPEPLFEAAAERGIRWVSYDRPAYGGSTPRPGRDLASAAADVAGIADALGIGRFAVMGHSGGSPHALACGALLPDRVLAAVCVSALAPFDAEGLDWFAGSPLPAWPTCRLRRAAAPPSSSISRPPTSTPNSSPRPTMRPSRVRGPGSAPSPGRPSPGAWKAWWTTTWRTSRRGASTRDR